MKLRLVASMKFKALRMAVTPLILLHYDMGVSLAVSWQIHWHDFPCAPDKFYWSNEPAHEKLIEDETGDAETDKGGTNCQAVVPWIPSQCPPASGIELLQTEGSEAMEAEEMGDGTMEIEDASESYPVAQEQAHGYAGQSASEGFQQWQQPHCMTPQLPQSVSTPLVWYR